MFSICNYNQQLQYLVIYPNQEEEEDIFAGFFYLSVRWSRSLDVSDKEYIWGRNCQIPFKPLQNGLLHHQNLFPHISIVRYEYEVIHLGGPDLLILGCNEHRAYTNQLKLLSTDSLHGEEPIHHVYGQVKSLGVEFELPMNFNQPIDQNHSHLFIDVGLGINVVVDSAITLHQISHIRSRKKEQELNFG